MCKIGFYVAVLLSRFNQESCTFICERFAFIPESYALFCKNVAFYENELNGRKTNKNPSRNHRYNATLKNYLGILTWYLTARRGDLISFDMRSTTVEK